MDGKDPISEKVRDTGLYQSFLSWLRIKLSKTTSVCSNIKKIWYQKDFFNWGDILHSYLKGRIMYLLNHYPMYVWATYVSCLNVKRYFCHWKKGNMIFSFSKCYFVSFSLLLCLIPKCENWVQNSDCKFQVRTTSNKNISCFYQLFPDFEHVSHLILVLLLLTLNM